MDLNILDVLRGAADTIEALRPAPGRMPDLGLLQDVFWPWAEQLGGRAPRAWLPVLAAHCKCAGPRCPERAVAECLVCGQTVCLRHGFVGGDAQVVCGGCVGRVQAATRRVYQAELVGSAPKSTAKKAPAPKEKTPLERAYAKLGCDAESSDEELEEAFDRLKARHQKQGGPAAKLAIKELTEALRTIAESRSP